MIYYVLIYGLLNNKTTDFLPFLKNGALLPVTGMILFFYTYFFAVRNLVLFLRYLLVFSFIVFILFFTTYFLGADLLPLRVLERGFVEEKRILLYGYSIISISISLGINVIFFSIMIKEKKWLLLAGGIMMVLFIISITRNLLLSVLIYFVVTYLLAFRLKFFRQLFSRRLVLFITIPALIILLLFPNYIDATRQTFIETFSVIREGRTSTGQEDTRLTLTGQKFIIGKFVEHPLLGTGFDPSWFSKKGDRAGYEASDYVFLGALAQHGILGLLIFLPIYIFLYRNILLAYRELRKDRGANLATEYDKLFMYFLVISMFIKLFIYVNYFTEAGWALNAHNFYITTGILYAIIYRKNKNIHLQTSKNQ
jgi:O-antigen ligase